MDRCFHKAWVLFTNDTDIGWLKFLKRGFRHCFVLLHDGKHWIAMDPLSNVMEVSIPDIPSSFDLPRWFQTQGYTVQRYNIQAYDKAMLPSVMSCVDVVKRVLGIHAPFILTPWQLYKYLCNTYQEAKEI